MFDPNTLAPHARKEFYQSIDYKRRFMEYLCTRPPAKEWLSQEAILLINDIVKCMGIVLLLFALLPFFLG